MPYCKHLGLSGDHRSILFASGRTTPKRHAHVLESAKTGEVERIREVTDAQQGSVEQMPTCLNMSSKHSVNDGRRIPQQQSLHHTLTAGVDAFSTALPSSVDQTLLRFDVALGEGVARLGSDGEAERSDGRSVERIEAMADSRRRK